MRRVKILVRFGRDSIEKPTPSMEKRGGGEWEPYRLDRRSINRSIKQPNLQLVKATPATPVVTSSKTNRQLQFFFFQNKKHKRTVTKRRRRTQKCKFSLFFFWFFWIMRRPQRRHCCAIVSSNVDWVARRRTLQRPLNPKSDGIRSMANRIRRYSNAKGRHFNDNKKKGDPIIDNRRSNFNR